MGPNSEQILAALKANGNNQRAAARDLGIPESTLRGLLRRMDTSILQDPNQILHDKVRRLEEELREANRHTVDDQFVLSKILTIKDSIDDLPPPRWLSAPEARSRVSTSVPTLMLSDLHWGETVSGKEMGGLNAYDLAIARKRLDTVVSKAISLLRGSIQGEKYPGFVLVLGGDFLTGDIHEELRETNEGTTLQALLDLYECMISQIDLLQREFGKVYVPCEPGNHGRTTHKPRYKRRNASNMDWLLYQFLARHYQNNPNVIVDAPVTPEMNFQVLGHTYHLCHGDQLGKGGDGIIGFVGPVIRGDHRRRSLQAQINRPYDTLLHGHYHTYMATKKFISNGSLIGYSEYSAGFGFGFELPQQAFWLTHADHGITFSMPVHAESVIKPEPKAWVSFEEAACR